MLDIIRDSAFGLVLNYLSGGKILPFRDQLPGYQIPERYLLQPEDVSSPVTRVPSSTSGEKTEKTLASDPEAQKEKQESQVAAPVDPFIVDWEGDDDPDNPRNWSSGKRKFVLFCVNLLTFSVYIGSAIYTPSIPGIMKEFGVSSVVGTLGLSLYILAYGMGPMILSPLQELPILGRTPGYIFTTLIFVLLQIPSALAVKNIGSVLVLRFLSGFFASPPLATGGASIQDIYEPQYLPYTVGIWAVAAVLGPVLGPIVGGFAAEKEGWRWTFWELLWVSGFALVFIIIFLPETLGDTVLLRRAQRLRKLTGNPRLRSLSEIKQAQMSPAAVIWEALVRPLQLLTEPAVFLLNIYLGFGYGIFYLWFEAFPIVFSEIHHFNLGLSGLPFIGITTGCVLSYIFYCFYTYYYYNPKMFRGIATGSPLAPESRLYLAVFTGFTIPISLFLFGWTSRPSVHWIVPIIGAGIYMPGIYLLFQCVLVYLPLSYPQYAASILAGNDFFRSSVASIFPLFGRPFFHNLGVGPGCSLLAGLALGMIPLLYLIIRFGAQLRARSKYAIV